MKSNGPQSLSQGMWLQVSNDNAGSEARRTCPAAVVRRRYGIGGRLGWKLGCITTGDQPRVPSSLTTCAMERCKCLGLGSSVCQCRQAANTQQRVMSYRTMLRHAAALVKRNLSHLFVVTFHQPAVQPAKVAREVLLDCSPSQRLQARRQQSGEARARPFAGCAAPAGCWRGSRRLHPAVHAAGLFVSHKCIRLMRFL